MKRKESTKKIALSDWVKLCDALDATVDIAPADLALKAQRLKENRDRYAKEALANRGLNQ